MECTFLTPDEVSRRYNGTVNVRTLANWRSLGISPPYCKLNGRIMYPLDALIEWERARTCNGTYEYGKISAAAVALLSDCSAREWVCQRSDGDAIRVSSWSQWCRVRARAGLPSLRLHDLRHTFASIGHKAGLTQREIASLLGHKQLSTTARYLNGFAGDDLAAVERVANVVGL